MSLAHFILLDFTYTFIFDYLKVSILIQPFIYLPSQDLPRVQRFFIPAVACPSCAYANDHLFRFCQMCGYQRTSVPRQPASKIAVDLAAIYAPLQQLRQTAKKSSYSKQKSSLRVEFETFLFSLPSVRSIYSATPEDVWRFLVW